MKEALKNQEPKQQNAFRNKYLAAMFAVAALLISSVVSAPTDELKYSKINGYGFTYKRWAADSILMVPLSASPHVPFRAGAIRYKASDSTLQLWTGHQWNSILTGVGNGVDTMYMLNDTTLTVETPNENFFVIIPGRPSRFGIDDILGIQDRNMNMQGHDFTIDSIGNMNLIGTASGIAGQLTLSNIARLFSYDNVDVHSISVYPNYIAVNGPVSNAPPKIWIQASDSLHTQTPNSFVVMQNDSLKIVPIDSIASIIGGASPIGPAGGALTGTYPNPSIANDSITTTKFRQSAALSVMGNPSNSTDYPIDIAAGNDGNVLRRFGTSLGFGAINLASNNAVSGVLALGHIDTSSANHAVTQSDLNDVAATKLNVSDSSNKWINDIRRRSGTDTVEKFKNGSWQPAYIDSTGGGIDTTILTLTPGTYISWDFSSGTFAQVSLSVNGTLSTPTNLFKGATGLLKVIHTVAGTTLNLPGLTEKDLNYRSIKSSVTFTTDNSTVQGADRYLKYIRVKPAHPLSALKIGVTNGGEEIQPAIAIDSAIWTTINVGEYYDEDSVLYFGGITSSTQIVYVTETNSSNTNFVWSYNAGDVDYVAFVYDGSTLAWSKSNYGNNQIVAGTTYEPESIAFFSVNTGLSTAVKDAVNNLVLAAKGIGWSKFAAIWPAVGGTATKNGYNLVDPSQFNITFSGGWTHSSTGSLADGTSGYAEVFTNLAQMDVDGYIGLNDFHFGYYNRTNFTPSTDCILFVNTSGGAIEWDNYGSNHFVYPWATGAGANINVARTGITGLCLVTRRASNDAEAYRDGTSIGAVTAAPPGAYTTGSMMLNKHYGGTPYYSPNEFSGGSCGKGLTSAEVTTWTNAWNAFQTALGR